MAENKKVAPANEKETKVTTTAAAKAAAPVKEEVKKEAAPAVKTAEEAKAPAKDAKTTTAKTAAKPAAKKTAAKKTTAKAEEKTEAPEKKTAAKTSTKTKLANVYVQYNNHEAGQEDLLKRIIEKWVAESGKKESSIKTFDVYIKPEDNAAYYVINGQGSSIALF